MHKKLNNNDNGHTLMEIIVVIIILGILASIAVPRYSITVEKTKSAEGVQILEALLNAQRLYRYENGTYTNDPARLDIEIDFSDNFAPPIVFNAQGPEYAVAGIRQIDKKYLLEINENGDLLCNDDIVGGDAGICAKMGYAEDFP